MNEDEMVNIEEESLMSGVNELEDRGSHRTGMDEQSHSYPPI